MNTLRHIFLQVDTDSIIALWRINKDISKEQVLAHTLIYNQGGMALGSAVKDFNITAEPGDQITFTILPLQLFSMNMLIFSEFLPEKQDDVVISNKGPVKGQSGFFITITEVKKDRSVEFDLTASFQFQQGGITETINICIDPMLRAKQGR